MKYISIVSIFCDPVSSADIPPALHVLVSGSTASLFLQGYKKRRVINNLSIEQKNYCYSIKPYDLSLSIHNEIFDKKCNFLLILSVRTIAKDQLDQKERTVLNIDMSQFHFCSPLSASLSRERL